eukprot:g73124.t1
MSGVLCQQFRMCFSQGKGHVREQTTAKYFGNDSGTLNHSPLHFRLRFLCNSFTQKKRFPKFCWNQNLFCWGLLPLQPPTSFSITIVTGTVDHLALAETMSKAVVALLWNVLALAWLGVCANVTYRRRAMFPVRNRGLSSLCVMWLVHVLGLAALLQAVITTLTGDVASTLAAYISYICSAVALAVLVGRVVVLRYHCDKAAYALKCLHCSYERQLFQTQSGRLPNRSIMQQDHNAQSSPHLVTIAAVQPSPHPAPTRELHWLRSQASLPGLLWPPCLSLLLTLAYFYYPVPLSLGLNISWLWALYLLLLWNLYRCTRSSELAINSRLFLRQELAGEAVVYLAWLVIQTLMLLETLPWALLTYTTPVLLTCLAALTLWLPARRAVFAVRHDISTLAGVVSNPYMRQYFREFSRDARKLEEFNAWIFLHEVVENQKNMNEDVLRSQYVICQHRFLLPGSMLDLELPGPLSAQLLCNPADLDRLQLWTNFLALAQHLMPLLEQVFADFCKSDVYQSAHKLVLEELLADGAVGLEVVMESFSTPSPVAPAPSVPDLSVARSSQEPDSPGNPPSLALEVPSQGVTADNPFDELKNILVCELLPSPTIVKRMFSHVRRDQPSHLTAQPQLPTPPSSPSSASLSVASSAAGVEAVSLGRTRGSTVSLTTSSSSSGGRLSLSRPNSLRASPTHLGPVDPPFLPEGLWRARSSSVTRFLRPRGESPDPWDLGQHTWRKSRDGKEEELPLEVAHMRYPKKDLSELIKQQQQQATQQQQQQQQDKQRQQQQPQQPQQQHQHQQAVPLSPYQPGSSSRVFLSNSQGDLSDTLAQVENVGSFYFSNLSSTTLPRIGSGDADYDPAASSDWKSRIAWVLEPVPREQSAIDDLSPPALDMSSMSLSQLSLPDNSPQSPLPGLDTSPNQHVSFKYLPPRPPTREENTFTKSSNTSSTSSSSGLRNTSATSDARERNTSPTTEVKNTSAADVKNAPPETVTVKFRIGNKDVSKRPANDAIPYSGGCSPDLSRSGSRVSPNSMQLKRRAAGDGQGSGTITPDSTTPPLTKPRTVHETKADDTASWNRGEYAGDLRIGDGQEALWRLHGLAPSVDRQQAEEVAQKLARLVDVQKQDKDNDQMRRGENVVGWRLPKKAPYTPTDLGPAPSFPIRTQRNGALARTPPGLGPVVHLGFKDRAASVPSSPNLRPARASPSFEARALQLINLAVRPAAPAGQSSQAPASTATGTTIIPSAKQVDTTSHNNNNSNVSASGATHSSPVRQVQKGSGGSQDNSPMVLVRGVAEPALRVEQIDSRDVSGKGVEHIGNGEVSACNSLQPEFEEVDYSLPALTLDTRAVKQEGSPDSLIVRELEPILYTNSIIPHATKRDGRYIEKKQIERSAVRPQATRRWRRQPGWGDREGREGSKQQKTVGWHRRSNSDAGALWIETSKSTQDKEQQGVSWDFLRSPDCQSPAVSQLMQPTEPSTPMVLASSPSFPVIDTDHPLPAPPEGKCSRGSSSSSVDSLRSSRSASRTCSCGSDTNNPEETSEATNPEEAPREKPLPSPIPRSKSERKLNRATLMNILKSSPNSKSCGMLSNSTPSVSILYHRGKGRKQRGKRHYHHHKHRKDQPDNRKFASADSVLAPEGDDLNLNLNIRTASSDNEWGAWNFMFLPQAQGERSPRLGSLSPVSDSPRSHNHSPLDETLSDLTSPHCHSQPILHLGTQPSLRQLPRMSLPANVVQVQMGDVSNVSRSKSSSPTMEQRLLQMDGAPAHSKHDITQQRLLQIDASPAHSKHDMRTDSPVKNMPRDLTDMVEYQAAERAFELAFGLIEEIPQS